jgi:rhodanese-related sulfurtransferase
MDNETPQPSPDKDIYAPEHFAEAEANWDQDSDVAITPGGIKLISRDELKEKLDRGDDFKLVMTYHEWAFRTMHIPGSINIFTKEQAVEMLDPSDEVVVYCTNVKCQASAKAFFILTKFGFKNVRRYEGGLQDWEQAGYPLEGDQGSEAGT